MQQSSATTVSAELLRRDDRIGRIRPGYLADLLVVDGNPLEDFACLQDQGRHLLLIMKGGHRVKDLLSGEGPSTLVPAKALGDRYQALGPVPR